MTRSTVAVVVCSTLTLLAGAAGAQPTAPAVPAAPAVPTSPYNYPEGYAPTPPPGEPAPPKEPKAGDFTAGGQLRLPNGPDEMGAYATFNWVAFDLKGRYYLTRSIKLDGNAPLAVKKPDTLGGGAIDPRMIGGLSITLDARLPRMNVPFAPSSKDTDLGLLLTPSYMRAGAVLLSEKDFPLFVGDFQPGVSGALFAKVKLSSLFDFTMTPTFAYQRGETESITAVQLPTSTIIKLGSVLELSADLGVFTGDDYAFSADDGGRIYAGAAIDLKVGPIITHAGTGFASLLTGGAYPTIGDSLYIDLNVKYAK